MTDTRPHKTPGPDHPITLERSPPTSSSSSGPVVIAETDRALEMREASYPPVLYIPLEDIDRHLLRAERSSHLVPVQGRGLLLRHRRRLTGPNWRLRFGTTTIPSPPSPASRATWPSTPTGSTVTATPSEPFVGT